MGSGGSKVEKQVSADFLNDPNGSVPSTPILTPKVKENRNLDPRSPSTHIARTPLQLLSAAAEKLEDFKHKELYSFGNDTPLNSKKILLGIDPRSPTLDFQRTPIVINTVNSELPKTIHNKNLDKARRSTIITTPSSTPEKQNIVSPKLLESSPFKPKPETIKRKSFVGLLETNIDFTETDLDLVILEKGRNRAKPLDDVTPTLGSHVNVKIDNIDPRSPTNDFLRTPIQIIKKIGDTQLKDTADSVIELEAKGKDEDLYAKEDITKVQVHNEDKSKVMQMICEEVVEINLLGRTSPANVTDIILQNVETNSAIDEQTEGENVIINTHNETRGSQMFEETKSAPVTPPVTETKQNMKPVISPIIKEAKSAPVTPPLVNITADVKELDKKLTNLIYEDENIVVCPRIVKLKEDNNRSPLKNRNIGEPVKKKSAQKLKVNDKPRRSDYVVSKIPVFKEKGKKIEVQCENTPPRNMEKRQVKVKKSHWDNADNTLVI